MEPNRGLVRSDQGVLARLVNLEDGAPAFQHAEMVALHGEQRAGHDVLVILQLESQVAGAQLVHPPAVQRG